MAQESEGIRLAGFRAVRLLPAIGPVTASAILQKVEGAKKPVAALSAHKVPNAAAEDWPKFVKLMGKLHRDLQGWPAEFDVKKFETEDDARAYLDRCDTAGRIIH